MFASLSFPFCLAPHFTSFLVQCIFFVYFHGENKGYDQKSKGEADLEKRFSEGEWVQAEGVEEWVEASSCSCERVFSYVTACDRGQTTERMCETLWVRCNGVEVEDWCPTEVFDELRLTQFRPRILKQPSKSQVQVDDGSLLLFEAYKDLEVQSVLPMDLDLDEEIRRLWAVPRRASKGKTACTASVPEIQAIYGVEGDPDSDVEEDIPDFPVCLTPVEPVATPPMQPEPVRVSTYLNFQYGVDSAVRKAIAQRTIHSDHSEWFM